jgi:hypothetical protein
LGFTCLTVDCVIQVCCNDPCVYRCCIK